MKLWEVKHPYYCTERNYFRSPTSSTETVWRFKSWAEFVAEMGNSDPDYNLLFRWDWREDEDWEDGSCTFNGDENYRNGRLLLFFMHQRKGYHSTSIVEVCRADEPAIRTYLDPKLAYLASLWAPLTCSTNAAKAADQTR